MTSAGLEVRDRETVDTASGENHGAEPELDDLSPRGTRNGWHDGWRVWRGRSLHQQLVVSLSHKIGGVKNDRTIGIAYNPILDPITDPEH